VKKKQIMVINSSCFVVKSDFFVVTKKRQILVNLFFMVKSSLFVVKKTNLGKFIFHGKITFFVVKKNKFC